MTQTVVVGGGPAGLAAAYRLLQPPGRAVLLLERAPVSGGLAAGFRHGECRLDFGPHRLHTATAPVVLADLRRLLGDELELRPRRGRIRLNGRYLPYPFGPRAVLGLGPGRLLHLAAGLVRARLGAAAQPAASYEAILCARVGAPLYRLFYGPYAEKVWGRPGHQIAADQAERRVNQRQLGDLVRLALGQSAARAYHYPRGGFGRIPAVYAAAVAASPGASVRCSAEVQAVEWRAGRVAALRYRADDDVVRVEAEHLVWSAPLPELVHRLDPPAPAPVQAAARRLRHRAVVLCYVTLNVPRVGSADTYYFPERRFPFNRVVEQKNFSPAMVPPDRTVLGMDIACDADDGVFAASDQQLHDLVVPALEEAGLARRERVVEVFSRRFRAAYPVYDLDYASALQQLQDWLARLDNLWLVGRQGLFLHNNTHHSLLMGYRAADAISSARGRAIWHDALAEFATFRVAD